MYTVLILDCVIYASEFGLIVSEYGGLVKPNSIGFFYLYIVCDIKRRLLDKSHLLPLCIKLVLGFPSEKCYFFFQFYFLYLYLYEMYNA